MEERDKIKSLELMIENLSINENPKKYYWAIREQIITVKSPILRRALYSKVDRVYLEYKRNQEVLNEK